MTRVIDDASTLNTRCAERAWLALSTMPREHDGDVTTFAEEKINTAYRDVTNKGARFVLLNFRQNDYINSAGIAILIGIVTEVNRNNQKLAVSGLSQHFQKIFRMVGLAQYAEIYQDEEEALGGFRRAGNAEGKA